MAGLKRRAQRAARGEEETDLLRAFAAGLAEECTKCGVDFAELLREGVVAEAHLMTCNDEASCKHAVSRFTSDDDNVASWYHAACLGKSSLEQRRASAKEHSSELDDSVERKGSRRRGTGKR